MSGIVQLTNPDLSELRRHQPLGANLTDISRLAQAACQKFSLAYLRLYSPNLRLTKDYTLEHSRDRSWAAVVMGFDLTCEIMSIDVHPTYVCACRVEWLISSHHHSARCLNAGLQKICHVCSRELPHVLNQRRLAALYRIKRIH